jgi:hypothetical protein
MVRKRDRGQDFALGKYIQYCRKVQVPHNSFFFVVHVYCLLVPRYHIYEFPALAALVSQLERIKP